MMIRSWSQDQATGAVTEIYNLSLNADGTTNKSLLSDKFSGAIQTGYLTGFTYDEAKKVWSYTVDPGANFGASALTTPNRFARATMLKSNVDHTDLFGQQVKVIYKTTTNDVVYGVYANDSAVLEDGVAGDIGTIDTTAQTVKVNGTAYKANSTMANVPVYNANNDTANGDTLATLKDRTTSFTFKAIDNDSDGKINCMVITPVEIKKITYVGSDNVTFSAPNGGNVKLEDIEIYDDFAKNDWVVYTNGAYTATGIDNYAKAEVKTASVDGIRDTTGEYRIDGSWYEKGNNSNVTGVTISLNDELEFVAMGGYLFYAKVKESETSSKDIAMVISAGQDTTLGTVQSSSVKAKLVFTDGTIKTVGVATVNGVTATFDSNAATSATDNVTARIGKLVTYTVNSDGDYELKDVSSSNKAGYKGVGSNAAYANKAIGGKELADDAVVFVYKGTANTAASTNEGKVYTGKEIKNAYGANSVGTALTAVSANANVACLYDTVNGFEYAKVAVLETTNGVTINAGSNYGYLVANAYETKEGGKTYTNLKFWDGAKDVETKWEKSGVLDQYKAGVIITYDMKDANEVKNVAVKTATVGVVTGWDDVKKIQLAGVSGTREINDDTVIMTINSKDKKGVEGASVSSIVIGEDTNNDDTADQPNVRYIVGTTFVDLLIIDVNNDMKAAPVAQIAGSTTATAAITAALNGADQVVVSGAATVDTALTIPEGKTVVIDGAATLSAAVTGAGKLVVNSFADAATSAAFAQTSTVEIVDAATAATIEAVPVVANKKLILGDKSSDTATVTSVSATLKFWATTGKAPVADPATAGENGTSALLAGTDANKIAAGTYVAGTVYYQGSAAGDSTATAWVKQ